jgi:UDP-3-O-[3-hydroxymyristoyl] glucosamine N-acyltransferase
VPDNTTISGYPARPHKENLKLQALVGKLPELFADVKILKDEVKNQGR